MPKKFIKPISLLLCFSFLFTQTGLAQLLPQPLSVPLQLPVLRYLSVNTANPSNYFNFLMDRGQRTEDRSQRTELNSEATKLISYFFLGLTLPSESFWVNLKPQEPERITSEELSKTDLGRTLLEQDLKLKKDMANYLHPKHPQGKLYWERLYQAIGKDKAKKVTITSSSRVWIVPAEAVVLETEDGALVAKATLKVLLESEYLSLSRKTKKLKNLKTEELKNEEEQIRIISENLIKEIILPALTKEINESPGYAPLRQVYHSLILAEWYKRKHSKTKELKNERTNPYASYINSGTTTGLESELPWEKQAIWQGYLKSYQEGEYKLQDTIFGLKRMYFSGGMELTKIGSAEVMKIIPFSNGSPILNNPEIRNNNGLLGGLVIVNPAGTTINTDEIPIGKPKIIFTESFIKENQEAPNLPDTSSISQFQEPGASKKSEISASSAVDVGKKITWLFFNKRKVLDVLGQGKLEIEKIVFDEYDIKIKARNNIEVWLEVSSYDGRITKISIFRKGRLIKIKSDDLYGRDEEYNLLKNKILTNLSDYAARNKNSQDRESHLSLLELKLNNQYNSEHDHIVREFMKLIRRSGDYNYDNLLEIEQISKDKAGFRNLSYWLKLANSKNQKLGSALKEYQDLSGLLKQEDRLINIAIRILDKNREITLQKFADWINIAKAKFGTISKLITDLNEYYKITTLLLEAKEYDHNIVFWVARLLGQNKEVEFSTLLEWIRTVKEHSKDPKLFLETSGDIYKNIRNYLAGGFLGEEKSLLTNVLIKNGGKLLLALWDIPDRGYLSMLLELSSTRLLERYANPDSYNREIKNLLLKYIDLLKGEEILSLFKNNLRNEFLKELLIKKVESEPSFIPFLLQEIELSADATGETSPKLASILIKARNTNDVIKKIIDMGSSRVIKGEHDTLFHYVVNLNLSKDKEKLKELIQETPDLFNKLFDSTLYGKQGFDAVVNTMMIPEIVITPEQLLNFLRFNKASPEERADFLYFVLLKDKNLFPILLSYVFEEGPVTGMDKERLLLFLFKDASFSSELRLEFIYEFLKKFINLPIQLQRQLSNMPSVGFRAFVLTNEIWGMNTQLQEEGIELIAKACGETPERIRKTAELFDAVVEVGYSDFLGTQDNLNRWLNVAENKNIIPLIKELEPYRFQFLPQSPPELLLEILNQKKEIIEKLKKIRQIDSRFQYVPSYVPDRYSIDPNRHFIAYLCNHPKLFLEKTEAILGSFNPEIFSYSERIKTTFSALGTPAFLIEPILDGTLNKTLIKASGSLLEAIKSQSQLTNGFSSYLINNPEVFKKNLEEIIEVFNPSLISELGDEIRKIDFQFLKYFVPYLLGASDFEGKFAEALFSLYKESDKETYSNINEFILKERGDIKYVFGYLQNNKVIPSANFLKNFLRKNDVSLLDILSPINDDHIFSYGLNLSHQIDRILNTDKRYETIRQALNYLLEIGVIVKGASLSYTAYDKEIDNFLDEYLKGNIGDKKFLSGLDNISRQIKAEAFRKIINRDLTEKEKEFSGNPSVDLYIGNLVGLYFRLKNSYPEICQKITLSIDNLLKLQDIEKFHDWLYKEADWNKGVYEELIKAGYNPLFWNKGIRMSLPIEDILKDIEEEMKKQTEQLIELAGKHKVEIDSQYKEKGIVSYKEAEEFAIKYLLNNETLSQETKDLVKAVLEDTKKYEEQYRNKVFSSKKVTVEITKNFLKDTHSGIGIPGCFSPHGSNNQMPMIHALETNALFLRVYDVNNKTIANAVLVLTPRGVVVQGIYNASNLDLDRVVFEGLAGLLLEDMVPSILFVNPSTGRKEALKYATTGEIIGVKKNTLNTYLYFDFSHTNSQSETSFKMDSILTKQELLDKGFKPSFKEIGEKADTERDLSINKPLSKKDKKTIMQELFTTGKLKELELSPILKNIEKIIFEWDEGKIEEVISSLTTRPLPKRSISEEEKTILRDKLLKIKADFQEKRLQESAGSPLQQSASSAVEAIKKTALAIGLAAMLLLSPKETQAFRFDYAQTPGGVPKLQATVGSGDNLSGIIKALSPFGGISITEAQIQKLVKKAKQENPQIIDVNLIFPGQKINLDLTQNTIDLNNVLANSKQIAVMPLKLNGREIDVYFIEGDFKDHFVAVNYGDAIVMDINGFRRQVEIIKKNMAIPNEDNPGWDVFTLGIFAGKTNEEIFRDYMEEMVGHEVIHTDTAEMMEKGQFNDNAYMSEIIQKTKLPDSVKNIEYRIKQELAAFLTQMILGKEPKWLLGGFSTFLHSKNYPLEYLYAGKVIVNEILPQLKGYVDYITEKTLEQARRDKGHLSPGQENYIQVKVLSNIRKGKYNSREYLAHRITIIGTLSNEDIRQKALQMYERLFGKFPDIKVEIPQNVSLLDSQKNETRDGSDFLGASSPMEFNPRRLLDKTLRQAGQDYLTDKLAKAYNKGRFQWNAWLFSKGFFSGDTSDQGHMSNPMRLAALGTAIATMMMLRSDTVKSSSEMMRKAQKQERIKSEDTMKAKDALIPLKNFIDVDTFIQKPLRDIVEELRKSVKDNKDEKVRQDIFRAYVVLANLGYEEAVSELDYFGFYGWVDNAANADAKKALAQVDVNLYWNNPDALGCFAGINNVQALQRLLELANTGNDLALESLQFRVYRGPRPLILPYARMVKQEALRQQAAKQKIDDYLLLIQGYANYGNVGAIRLLLRLTQEGNELAKTYLAEVLNRFVLELRQAHLERGVSGRALESMLAEVFPDDPMVFYLAFPLSREFR